MTAIMRQAMTPIWAVFQMIVKAECKSIPLFNLPPGRKKAPLKNIKKFVIIIIEKVLTFYLGYVIINTSKRERIDTL